MRGLGPRSCALGQSLCPRDRQTYARKKRSQEEFKQPNRRVGACKCRNAGMAIGAYGPSRMSIGDVSGSVAKTGTWEGDDNVCDFVRVIKYTSAAWSKKAGSSRIIGLVTQSNFEILEGQSQNSW